MTRRCRSRLTLLGSALGCAQVCVNGETPKPCLVAGFWGFDFLRIGALFLFALGARLCKGAFHGARPPDTPTPAEKDHDHPDHR